MAQVLPLLAETDMLDSECCALRNLGWVQACCRPVLVLLLRVGSVSDGGVCVYDGVRLLLRDGVLVDWLIVGWRLVDLMLRLACL